MFNHAETAFTVKKGDRIAQLVCERIYYPDIEVLQTLNETDRGEAGFGSTGTKWSRDMKFVYLGKYKIRLNIITDTLWCLFWFWLDIAIKFENFYKYLIYCCCNTTSCHIVILNLSTDVQSSGKHDI